MVEWTTIILYVIGGGAILWYGIPFLLKTLFFILNKIGVVFLFIKNHIKPIELPKYKWIETQLDDSLGYEWVKVKFYATKNWVEIYAWMFGNLDDVDRKEERLIIPKWKIVSYNKDMMKLISSIKDYQRYGEWNK